MKKHIHTKCVHFAFRRLRCLTGCHAPAAMISLSWFWVRSSSLWQFIFLLNMFGCTTLSISADQGDPVGLESADLVVASDRMYDPSGDPINDIAQAYDRARTSGKILLIIAGNDQHQDVRRFEKIVGNPEQRETFGRVFEVVRVYCWEDPNFENFLLDDLKNPRAVAAYNQVRCKSAGFQKKFPTMTSLPYFFQLDGKLELIEMHSADKFKRKRFGRARTRRVLESKVEKYIKSGLATRKDN